MKLEMNLVKPLPWLKVPGPISQNEDVSSPKKSWFQISVLKGLNLLNRLDTRRDYSHIFAVAYTLLCISLLWLP